MNFDPDFFQKRSFTKGQIDAYFQVASRDLEIAQKGQEVEVIFLFSYNALIKFGIYIIAKKGYKVKSRMGHHVKIIKALSALLNDKEVFDYGNIMRKKINIDLYSGGVTISEKEASEYLDFVKKFFNKHS